MGPHCGLSLQGCFVQTCPFVITDNWSTWSTFPPHPLVFRAFVYTTCLSAPNCRRRKSRRIVRHSWRVFVGVRFVVCAATWTDLTRVTSCHELGSKNISWRSPCRTAAARTCFRRWSTTPSRSRAVSTAA